jgi:hypothetical protein
MEINDRQDFVDKLPRKTVNTQTVGANIQPLVPDDITFTDDEIIEKARNAKNGAKFKLLFDYGDTADYGGDESRADLALCDLIKFWTKEADQIYRIVMKSALADGKWQRRDYADGTIALALSQADITAPAQQEVDDEIYQRAREIHESGDPVNFILDVFNTMHLEDRTPATGILCGFACQNIMNAKGLQPGAYGESGHGKSHLAETMCWLAPQEYILNTTLTDAALYNLRDKFRPGTTIFSDDVVLPPAIADILKRSTSRYQKETQRISSQHIGGKWVSEFQTLPPRIMWLLTSVDQSGGIQVANRQLAFCVDESEGHQQKVVDFEIWKAENGIEAHPLNADVEVCREIIRQFKIDKDGNERLFRVKIPDLRNLVNWNDIKNNRNLDMFLDLIRAFAVLRFRQRECNDYVLIANADDFNAAFNLYSEYALSQMHHVTKQEKIVLQYIMEHPECAENGIINDLHMIQQRVNTILNNMLGKVPGLARERRSDSESDLDGRRRGKSFFVYTIDKTKFALGDYDSALTRRKGGDKRGKL